jgi:uncharacterized phiE125 gp8 family phage protein
MISYLLAGPAEEPVSLAEAKAFLRLDADNDDGLVLTLISAARLHVESVTGRALVNQNWRLVLDAWPVDGVVTLPVSPLVSLTVITAYDAQGDDHVVPMAQFEAATGVTPARLILPRTVDGMPVLRERFGIEVDYVAGFGDATDVPSDLKRGVLALVAHWYEHRDAVLVAGSGAVIPPGFGQMISPYRQVRL